MSTQPQNRQTEKIERYIDRTGKCHPLDVARISLELSLRLDALESHPALSVPPLKPLAAAADANPDLPESGYKCASCGYVDPDPIPSVLVRAGKCRKCCSHPREGRYTDSRGVRFECPPGGMREVRDLMRKAATALSTAPRGKVPTRNEIDWCIGKWTGSPASSGSLADAILALFTEGNTRE